MHPALRPYYDHVIPVFWPWLWLNLIRFALWHLRTGREALLAVDCFGNIRIVHLSDEPKPDDLYTYEAPLLPRWKNPALSSDLPISVPTVGDSVLIPSLCRVYAVFYVVRERVRGPPILHLASHPSTSLRMSPVLYRNPKALMLSASRDQKSHRDFPEKAQAQAQGIEA